MGLGNISQIVKPANRHVYQGNCQRVPYERELTSRSKEVYQKREGSAACTILMAGCYIIVIRCPMFETLLVYRLHSISLQ